MSRTSPPATSRWARFPGPALPRRWSAGYKDGTPDTAGQVSGGKSGYYPSKVLSVRNGSLDWYLHSENGISWGPRRRPRSPNASTNPPRANSLLHGRYSVRYRADALPGFKTAWLLWPDSGVWPRDGEMDFPEGDLGQQSLRQPPIYVRIGKDALNSSFPTNTFPQRGMWPRQSGPPDALSSSLTDDPSASAQRRAPTPMHFILQTESCLPLCPAPETQGHVSLDWVSIWVPA